MRSEERGILERAGVTQSLTVGVAPIVVVIASVCTFTLHMALGYDLTAAEVSISNRINSMCACQSGFSCFQCRQDRWDILFARKVHYFNISLAARCYLIGFESI